MNAELPPFENGEHNSRPWLSPFNFGISYRGLGILGVADVLRQNSITSTNSVTSDIFDEVDDRDQRRSTLINVKDQNKTMLLQVCFTAIPKHLM